MNAQQARPCEHTIGFKIKYHQVFNPLHFGVPSHPTPCKQWSTCAVLHACCRLRTGLKQRPALTDHLAAARELHYGAAPRRLLPRCRIIIGGRGKTHCCCHIISIKKRVQICGTSGTLFSRADIARRLPRPLVYTRALASQHLHTLYAQAMRIRPFISSICHGHLHTCLQR